jgi:hypothetical protein
MADKQFLFIDHDLLDKIDRRRGGLSYTEFVESCINSFLGKEGCAVPRPSRGILRSSDKRVEKPVRRTLGKNSLVFMDEDLLDRIDESRGEVTRAEFIEQCIDSRFPKAIKQNKGYATRDEFQEFKGFIKNTLKDMAKIIFNPNALSRTGRFSDVQYQPRGGYGETSEYRGSGPSALPPRPRGGEYRRDDYRPPRRPPLERTGDRLPPQDREPSWRERSDRFASQDRRDSSEYPPPRDRLRYSGDYGYPPPPPRQNAGDSAPQNRGQLQRLINNLKKRLQNWLFTQEEPVPASSAYQPPVSQTRHSEYEVSRHDVYHHDVPPRREVVASEAPPVPEEEETSPNMHAGLWALAILLFGFGDTLLSTMVFSKGGYEANPLMGGLVSMFGGSIVAFVIIKTVIMGILALISFKVFKNQGWLIPAILIVVGIFLVLSNLMAYVKL